MMIVLLSALNLLVNGMAYLFVRKLYQESTIIRRELPFTATRHKRHGRGGITAPYMYMLNVSFRGEVLQRVITKEQYESLQKNTTGYANFYIREYKTRLLSPNWDKYEVALTQEDFETYKEKWKGGFLFMAIAFEFVILAVGYQL